jgi:hypothetical protein
MNNLSINPEFSFTDSCILFIKRSNTCSSNIEFFKVIDIAETYKNVNDKFEFYTSSFAGFGEIISTSKISDIFKYGKLYHFYIPGNYINNWTFEICYFNFYTKSLQLLFNLKYPNIGAANKGRNYYLSLLFSDFQNAYETFIQKQDKT